MNVTSAFPADGARAADTEGRPALKQVRVWDLPVRLFHWLMVGCFAGAWITAESERWRLLHATLGYTMLGLVAFRIVWGLVGTRHARFASFVRGPSAVLRYLKSLLGRNPEHHVGHNPAGALAIVLLLGLTLVVAASGWATLNEIGGDWLEELHEGAANAMMAVVLVHVAGVAISSFLHRENLVKAMVNGYKPGRPEDGVPRARVVVASLLLAAVLGFWWWQWQEAPAGAGAVAVQRHAGHASSHDDDHRRSRPTE